VAGVRGLRRVEDAIRLVWASLWSDAALLYRSELGLDPARSRMAVLIQEEVEGDRSGVAFARDPRTADDDVAIVEAVAGPCRLLVDGLVDPDRWELDPGSRRVRAWRAGHRDAPGKAEPLLEPADLEQILVTLASVEARFGWPPDLEWTGRRESFHVLQARPITTHRHGDDERGWYLTLRPGEERLRRLRQRVAGKLIPELKAEGQALADEPLEDLDDASLAESLDRRAAAVKRWKKIYWDEFIPLAHGVRRLATFYNDTVRPEDPYEFVGLLQDQPLIAIERNRAFAALARDLAANAPLRAALERLVTRAPGPLTGPTLRAELAGAARGVEAFVDHLEDVSRRYLDIAYDHERLTDRLESLLQNLLELSDSPSADSVTDAAASAPSVANAVTAADPDAPPRTTPPTAPGRRAARLEQRLFEAVGPDGEEEAREILDTGRVSWKLRDDDNLLVARLESQLLRAVEVAASRLRAQSRLEGEAMPTETHSLELAGALRDRSTRLRIEPDTAAETPISHTPPGETPRQLVGQPASPGVATGPVRCVRGRHDLGSFRRGEVLVCDAIQPTMTHLVPLAGAIVERRGGMLIHGAIIARELGIPCVNGIRDAVEILATGQLVTVDGHLGIVTVGPPDFDLELAPSA
jgi:pyruvate,water dikinase